MAPKIFLLCIALAAISDGFKISTTKVCYIPISLDFPFDLLIKRFSILQNYASRLTLKSAMTEKPAITQAITQAEFDNFLKSNPVLQK